MSNNSPEQSTPPPYSEHTQVHDVMPAAADFEPTPWERIKDLFSLHLDTDEAGTIDNIRKGVIFRGGNLWALIFAALIASIGLNVNSVAVIIGAMLISPLMGPIVGIGYAAGSNDFEFMKTAGRNLALMVVLALGASIIYFFLSPLGQETQELLNRTRPNIYDVLIATFGGGVGIVAASRKDRGNAIPGVAIATALMPPLCTAGYYIANGNFTNAFGAFYLFFINSVFIALSAMFFVRFLNFPQKEFLDKELEKRVRLIISSLVVITIIPSVFTAYHAIKEAIFKSRAAVFVEENIKFKNTTVLNPKFEYGSDTAKIDLVLIGEPLAEQVVNSIQEKLQDPKYGLSGTKLVLHQSNNVQSYYGGAINSSMVESIMREKDKTIEELRKRIEAFESGKVGSLASKGGVIGGGSSMSTGQLTQLSKKLTALYPEITRLAYSEAVEIATSGENTNAEIVPTIFLQASKEIDEASKGRIANFLIVELGIENLRLVVQ